jgi:SAM-dependent methyltransferase
MNSNFNSYAQDYELMHNQNLEALGLDSREFVHAKLVWCARLTARYFRSVSATKTFLDYGCGTGRFGHEFYSYFDPSWDYVGVDPSEASIRQAEQQCSPNINRNSCTPKRPAFQTLDSWPCSSPQYNFILAACVFHHIEPDDRLHTFQKLWQVLKPGGVLLIWEHNPWNPITRRIVSQCIFDDDAQLLSIRAMVHLWKISGLKGEKCFRFLTFFPGPLRRLTPLERLLGWVPLGGQWVFWARKPY